MQYLILIRIIRHLQALFQKPRELLIKKAFNLRQHSICSINIKRIHSFNNKETVSCYFSNMLTGADFVYEGSSLGFRKEISTQPNINGLKIFVMIVAGFKGALRCKHWLPSFRLFEESLLPHIVMLLNIDLVEHHILLFGIYVSFHLHGDMSRKHREEKAFLQMMTVMVRGKRGERHKQREKKRHCIIVSRHGIISIFLPYCQEKSKLKDTVENYMNSTLVLYH